MSKLIDNAIAMADENTIDIAVKLEEQCNKIPDICQYNLQNTCGFGEIEPYDMCPAICPKYKESEG